MRALCINMQFLMQAYLPNVFIVWFQLNYVQLMACQVGVFEGYECNISSKIVSL